jgi:hypothetical protein
MGSDWTVADVLSRLPRGTTGQSPAPEYRPVYVGRALDLGLCVESMRDHMTDEGWTLFKGLQNNGWRLTGAPYGASELDFRITDCRDIANLLPRSLLLQDKNEWDVGGRDFRDASAGFQHTAELRGRRDIFKLIVRKDAHQRQDYNKESADEVGVHAWVVYYDPRVVHHLSPFMRPQHIIRTWHSLEPSLVPPFSAERSGVLFSGALGNAYPLRNRMQTMRLPECTYLPHPKYHRRGCATPEFLRTLSKFRVAVCTSSRYGYVLRKMVEATACGCTVFTDLPTDEVVPGIDGNLVRVHPDTPERTIVGVLKEMLHNWDAGRQRHFAEEAKRLYDWRATGARLAADIEALRRGYDRS